MSDWLVLLHGETECWSLLGVTGTVVTNWPWISLNEFENSTDFFSKWKEDLKWTNNYVQVSSNHSKSILLKRKKRCQEHHSKALFSKINENMISLAGDITIQRIDENHVWIFETPRELNTEFYKHSKWSRSVTSFCEFLRYPSPAGGCDFFRA